MNVTTRISPSCNIPSFVAGLLLAWGLGTGCVGTSTGNPAEDDDQDRESATGDGCDVERSDIDRDDASTGFSADDIMAFAAGEHTMTLRWFDGAAPYGPESGDGTITIGVESRDAPVVHLDREPLRPDDSGDEGHDPIGEIGYYCEDGLEIPVTLALSTQGGAFDERIEAVLIADRVDAAQLRIELDLDALGGLFNVELVPEPDTKISATLEFQLQLTKFGHGGEMRLFVERETADAVSQSAGPPIARFPAESNCPGGLSVAGDTNLGGYTPGELAVKLAAATEALTIEWPDADASSFSLQLNVGMTCLFLEQQLRVEMTGVAELSSGDDRLRASLEVLLMPEFDMAGDLARLQLRTAASGDERSVAEIEALVSDVDLGAYDAAMLDLRGVFSPGPDDSLSADGTLEVIGTKMPECEQAPEGADYGNGCEGNIDTVVLLAPWHD